MRGELTNLRTSRTVRVYESKPAKPLKPVYSRSKTLRRASDDLQLAVVLTALLCVCLSIIN